MAQGKIDNVKKVEVCVTDQDNSECFNSKLPTKNQGFCIISRTVYGIERKGNIYFGLIARRGRSPLKVSSFDLEKWDIDATPKEQPVALPDHPAQPPEDPKRNTCPQCRSEAVDLGDHFKCDSIFCQAEFVETGTGPELAPGGFEVGQEFEIYWMEKQYEMHATICILSRLKDNMTIEINGAEIAGVEVYASGSAEAFRNPRDEKTWVHPWNKRELRIKCSPLQAQSLKVQLSSMDWPIRLHPDQIDHMNVRSYSHAVGQLTEIVKRKLQDDSGHDEVVFF